MPYPVAACRGHGLLVVGVTLPITDAFAAANGTNLNGRATDTGGASWTVQAGSFDIQSNRANVTSVVGSQATVDSGAADCTITVIGNTPAGGAPAIIFRFTDTNNFWYARISEGGNTWAIVENNAGVFTTRATTAVTIDPATDYTLQIVLLGQSITGTVDGANSINYASAAHNQTATKHGIYEAGGVTGARFEDFSVNA